MVAQRLGIQPLPQAQQTVFETRTTSQEYFECSKNECPKCGHRWTTATLFTLESSLAKLKSENADLPVFASAYLRNKLAYDVPAWDIEIYPNAVVNLEGQKVEIDVYLPQFGIGLECKVFEDALAPLTKNRLGSIVGDVAQKVERFLAAGIESVVVVTNLPAESARRLKAELEKSIQQKGVKIKDLEVVQGDVNALIQMLDRLSGNIAKKVSEKLSKMVEKVALRGEPPKREESAKTQQKGATAAQ